MKKPNTNSVATTRKLKLARQTLRLLSAPELLEVAGGATETCYTCYPCVTNDV